MTNMENIPSFKFKFYNCKLVGLDPLTVNYEGNPISYSVTILPETYDYE
jgi:hypothetical protein